MDFLGTPDVGPLLFAGLTVASFAASFIAVFTGAAGGVVLLALMAVVMPPAVVVPVHTVVMLGSGVTRSMIMWRHVMRWTVLPFVIGSAIGLRRAQRFSSRCRCRGCRAFSAPSSCW